MEKLMTLLSRLFFLGAFVLLALALLERAANMFGYTFSPTYQSGRLLEFAVALLVFVIAFQLHAIKEGMKAEKGSAEVRSKAAAG